MEIDAGHREGDEHDDDPERDERHGHAARALIRRRCRLARRRACRASRRRAGGR